MNGSGLRLLGTRPCKGCPTSASSHGCAPMWAKPYCDTNLESAAVKPVAGSVAAVDRDHDAVDIVRSGRCQKPARADHVRRLAPAPRRRTAHARLFKRRSAQFFGHLGE